jgi:polyphenol oxidase
MSLFGSSPAGVVLPRWLRLRRQLCCATIVHAHQVHGGDVRVHDRTGEGVLVAGDADGHVTARPGVLLAVSVADCVPIFLVAPRARAVALLHAGWRSAVAGILEHGIDVLLRVAGAEPGELHAHLGPAICGDCFEVGPEVPAALGIQAPEDEAGRARIDLRAALAGRALARGMEAEHVSVSAHCTRCGDSPFYSHRAGCRERQLALLGVPSG